MGLKFNDKINEECDNILIVDGLNLAFRYKHSGQKDFAASYRSTILSLATSYNAGKIILLGDWGSVWRKEIDPEYKANRTKMKEEQTQQEADDFKDFLEELEVAFELMDTDAMIFKLKGVEADDIAAYMVKHIPKDKYEHIWLISSDKDWDLLVSDKVSRFSYVTRKEITSSNWGEHYPYDVDTHISVKVLQGDKGDNVRGIAGVGEKRAVQILESFGPTAFDVYASLPLPGKQKFIENTNAFGDRFLVNYELMDLMTYCDDAVLDHKDKLNEYIEGL